MIFEPACLTSGLFVILWAMKALLLCLTVILFFCFCQRAAAQLPGVKYSKYINNNRKGNVLLDVQSTRDRGLVVVGVDTPNNLMTYYNPTVKGGYTKAGSPYIARLDSAGNTLWEKGNFNFPNDSTRMHLLSCIQVLGDSGFITAGYSQLSTAYHPSDTVAMLVMRLDRNGNMQWRRSMGGSGAERGFAVVQAQDGGYLVAGTTTSNDIDVSGNHLAGNTDAWLVKLNASGKVVWQKCYGGSGMDTASAMIATPDGGFVIAGSSTSTDGDLTMNKGLNDGWLFKIDGQGTLLWSKAWGGSGSDAFRSLTAGPDGELYISGYTSSPDVATNGNHGQTDAWVVTVDAGGGLVGAKSFGGAKDDYGMSIQYTLEGSLLVGGYTYSSDGDVAGQHGGSDLWLFNSSVAGDLLWQQCGGTANNEFGMSALLLGEGSAVIAGAGVASSQTVVSGLIYAFGNGNRIVGSVFLDGNRNNVWDIGEPAMDEVRVQLERGGAVRAVMPYQGKFMIQTDTGTYTMSVSSPYDYFAFSPASAQTVVFNSYGNKDSVGFALQPIPGIRDLQLSIYVSASGFNLFRPMYYNIFYRNAGTEPIANAMVTIIKDRRSYTPLVQPFPSSQSGDTLRWVLPTLNPGSSGYMLVELALDFQTAALGDTIQFMGYIEPTAGDRTPADDSARVLLPVTGSYDPNGKVENNGGSVLLKDLQKGQYLNYTVFFQNTGTDTAWDIRVRDTCDARLDMNTLQVVGSSAPYQLSISDGNRLSWLFSGINLPDSNRNEAASHGYVAYRIKPKTSIAAGDSVLNTASIYFDYNLPVATNTAQTLVNNPLPLLPPTPVIAGLRAGYCNNLGAQKILITNIPAPVYQATVLAYIDNAGYTVGADSSIRIRPDTLAAGLHTFWVIFKNQAGADTVEKNFVIDTAVTPVVDLSSSTTNITSLAQLVVVTASNMIGGGASPLYTFGKNPGFTDLLQGESPLNTVSLDPSALQIGNNVVYVRMRTSDTCHTQETGTDSIVIVRSAVTGLVDIDFPGQVININPNPFIDNLIIKGLQTIKTYTATLLSSSGQLITRKTVSGQREMTLSTGVIPHGVYLLRIYDGKKGRLIGSATLLQAGK